MGRGAVFRSDADGGSFRSPRAWAFVLLGLDAYCSAVPGDFRATRLRAVLADQLISIFDTVATDDWVWFEDGLAYDNARLPQALIMTGIATKTSRYVDIGLESLRWLVTGKPQRRANSARSARRDLVIDANRRKPSTSNRWRPGRPSRPA